MISLKNIVPFMLAGIIASSCSDFVDIKTQGQLVPKEVENYRLLLNNSSALRYGPQFTSIASDDVALIDGSAQQASLGSSDYYAWWKKVYAWQSEIYPLGSYQTDYSWNAMYNTIAYANTVITEVMEANGSEEEKLALRAEAYVHRADAYLMLVNTYAKTYVAASAGTDLGVPLVLTQTTSQSLTRASVQKVYEQIIMDLKAAVPYLPTQQEVNTHPSLAAAYGELARTYLYMGDYVNANAYADSALMIQDELVDLGQISYVSTSTYPVTLDNPEILLSKMPYGGYAYYPLTMRLSDDLMSVLGTADQRYNLFTVPGNVVSSYYLTAADGRYFYLDYAMYEGRNIGPTVPEMYLIKAEYYARTNNPAEAMNWVNKLRLKRFKTADYTAMTATDGNNALTKVIDERRREFFCRMLRWWDMRRLSAEGSYTKTITRTFAGETYTLAPNSNRYVFPIPTYQIQLNPEMEQNPE